MPTVRPRLMPSRARPAAGGAPTVLVRTVACLALVLAAVPPAAAQRPGFGPPGFVPGEIGTPHGSGIGGGHGGHGGGGHGGAGRARAAFYDVITVGAVTDAAAVKAAVARLAPSLAGTSGRLLVNADDPTAAVGAGPSHLAVVAFDDVWSAQAWQRSEAVRSILADLGKAGTVAVVTAGGIADPGARPSFSAEALGPGRAVRLPEIPKIADICKGC